eukprot:c23067_g1_i1.p1 GENE.c23067_g1_i1~~c23067_g1_i1.p1  ORF type:complete len:272 (+),score=73.93 c23067_g1_i1:24-818(+)
MAAASFLAGKRILVTGATSGIGLATCRILARDGATICATGRNQAALDALAAELNCATVAADLTQPGACEFVVTSAVEKLGALTSLVCCAGVLKGGAFGSEACNLDNFMYNFNTNTKPVFELMTHSVPHLKAQAANGPSIVNVSSINGLASFPGCASYCASKSAVDQLTKCAALDLAEFGIRVNSVNPGVVVTELQKRGGMSEEAYQAFMKRSIEVTHPLGKALQRVATPDEVGEVISFLVSSRAGFITGDCIKVDGGRSILGPR